MTEQVRIEVGRRVEAPASVVFELVVDPAGHVDIDGSGMLVTPADPRPMTAVGDTFVMHMDREPLGDVPLGRYTVQNTVTRFVDGTTFEWGVGREGDAPFGHVYGYRLTPVGDDVTDVTLYYDWSGIPEAMRDRVTFPVVPVHMLERSMDNLARIARDRATGGGGYAARGLAAPSADARPLLQPFRFRRRALRPGDVLVDVAYCGICHTDLHVARNDWGSANYPVVPGHEIVGIVAEVGPGVSRHAVGDRVAIGCMVDSCRECDQCEAGREQFCRRGSTVTYNGRDRVTKEPTFGGYSDRLVVREEFALKVPDALDLARIAPVLCAGITTWSPLRHWGVGAGSSVAVAGLGGLGHMGVKLAVALGAEVTVITTSEGKVSAARELGAHDVILAGDADAVRAAQRRFDLILDTIPVVHDVAPYLGMVAVEGAHVIVGVVDQIPSFHSGLLLGGRRTLSASPIGGLVETQELLDFCAEHAIHPDTETISVADVDRAWDRMERADVKYRFVIDMATLRG